MNQFINLLLQKDQPTETKTLRQMNPIALAFVGDSIFDLYLRSHLVSETGLSPKELHVQASSFANAASQARMARRIEEEFTEDEHDIYRRGRNSKVNTVPHNASLSDYHAATGFEAVLGYLFLSGQEERLVNIMSMAVSVVKEKCDDQ